MKKLIALLLALVMVITITACGTTQPAETEAPKADTPVETKAPKETDAPETEAPAEEEPVVITVGLGKKDTVENYDTNAMTLKIEEVCNVDLQFVYFSNDANEFATQFGLMATNKETLPDIVVGMGAPGNVDLYNEYGANGYFVDLSPYLLDETKTPNWHESMTYAQEGSQEFLLSMVTTPEGQIFNWPNLVEASANMIGHHVYINQKWLDEVGMEMPTTTDEFYAVLKAFKEKHPDLAPAIGATDYRADLVEWILNAYIYNYLDYFWNVENGKLYTPYNTDEYREGLIFVKKLFDEGLIDSLTLTSKLSADLIPYVTPDGQETSAVGLFNSHNTLAVENDHEALFEFDSIISLDAGTGKGGKVVMRTQSWSSGSGITTDCKNVEKAIEILDYISSVEGTISSQKGICGERWVYVEPGTGSSTAGYEAVYKMVGDAIWGKQNNECWNQNVASVFTLKGCAMLFADDESYASRRSAQQRDLFQKALATETPDEVVKELIYTSEELEVVAEYRTILQEFVRSQRMLFAAGQMDPANDADWETYCNELEAQGLNEWLECAQAAYDRMNG